MTVSMHSMLRSSAVAMTLVFATASTFILPTPAFAGDSNNVTAIAPAAGVPAVFCRPGYSPIGTRLCMTGGFAANSFANAMAVCEVWSGRVADYGDWRYRFVFGDGALAPLNWWLGPITADNQALFVNWLNAADFDGETSRFDSRPYACAHDRF